MVTDIGKPKVLAESLVSVSLCPPQILHGLPWDSMVRSWYRTTSAVAQSLLKKLYTVCTPHVNFIEVIMLVFDKAQPVLKSTIYSVHTMR
jgi:hypothetical protein